MARAPVQTIERTSKELKAGQLVGVLLVLGGLGMCCYSTSDTGLPVMLLGLIVIAVSGALSWWHHG